MPALFALLLALTTPACANTTTSKRESLPSPEPSGHATPRALPSLDAVTYGYDGNGNVTSVAETRLTASGPATETTGRIYDGLDRLEKETRPDGREVSYGYDLKGNRTQVTDPDGVATGYTYDAQDRLKTVVLSGSTTTYAYHPDSLLAKTTAPGVEEGRCYDAAGRLVTVVTAKGSVSGTCAVSGTLLSRYVYGHDANGNRTSLVETRTAAGAASASVPESTGYGYDALDRLVGVRYPDGTAHLYELDAEGNRLVERRTQEQVSLGYLRPGH